MICLEWSRWLTCASVVVGVLAHSERASAKDVLASHETNQISIEVYTDSSARASSVIWGLNESGQLSDGERFHLDHALREGDEAGKAVILMITASRLLGRPFLLGGQLLVRSQVYLHSGSIAFDIARNEGDAVAAWRELPGHALWITAKTYVESRPTEERFLVGHFEAEPGAAFQADRVLDGVVRKQGRHLVLEQVEAWSAPEQPSRSLHVWSTDGLATEQAWRTVRLLGETASSLLGEHEGREVRVRARVLAGVVPTTDRITGFALVTWVRASTTTYLTTMKDGLFTSAITGKEKGLWIRNSDPEDQEERSGHYRGEMNGKRGWIETPEVEVISKTAPPQAVPAGDSGGALQGVRNAGT